MAMVGPSPGHQCAKRKQISLPLTLCRRHIPFCTLKSDPKATEMETVLVPSLIIAVFTFVRRCFVAHHQPLDKPCANDCSLKSKDIAVM